MSLQMGNEKAQHAQIREGMASCVN